MAKDRISSHVEMKINLGNFQNVTINIGYDSDVKKSETVKDAFKRVEEQMEESFTRNVRHWVKKSRKELDR